MLLDGERVSGQDVRNENVTAAMAIANIVKSSLGPVGLDKMLVDEIGDVSFTLAGATILAQLDIEHPAAKVLVELAQLQVCVYYSAYFIHLIHQYHVLFVKYFLRTKRWAMERRVS